MSVYQRFYHIVRDNQGNVVSGATCKVYNVGTDTLSTIYDPGSDDSSPQGIPNPFITSSDGKFGFFALDGEYDIRITGGHLAAQAFRVTLSTADAGVGALASADLANTSSSALGDALVGVKKTGGSATTDHTFHENREFNVKTDFYATGDGTTDDAAAIQAAFDALTSGGTLLFPPGTYRVGKHFGTNDAWGVKLTNSRVRLLGYGATLRRFDTNIAPIANAYPILFVGTPDSNATQVTDITIEGLTFQGEDTRHATSGAAPIDLRDAIHFKNTLRVETINCTFTAIDSAAIVFQPPATLNEKLGGSNYYNTTKSSNAKIRGCTFKAAAHTTPGRALLHAVNLSGVDFAEVIGNGFEWCDDAVNGSGTFDDPSNTLASTYTHATMGATVRSGRGWIVSDNTFTNSSEHAIYAEGMDVVIKGNNFFTDDPATCNAEPLKVRARCCTISGNNISNHVSGVSIAEPSYQVSVTGNQITTSGEVNGGAAVDLAIQGLMAYIRARPFLTAGTPCFGISITGNTFNRLKTSADTLTTESGSAIRIYTDPTNYNDGTSIVSTVYPNGELLAINISGNTFRNYRAGIYVVHGSFYACAIDGNTFYAKPFTQAGFAGGTTMNTYAAVMFYHSSWDVAALGQRISFTNNVVHGSKYIFAVEAAGTAHSAGLPWNITGNTMNYVQNFADGTMNFVNNDTRFSNNVGIFFLDRTTWLGATAIGNALYDGTTANTQLKYQIVFDGTQVKFAKDDAATYVVLG